MKKILLIITIILFSSEGFAQAAEDNYNKITLEMSYGLSIPFGASKVSASPDPGSFVSFSNINLGARYMFNVDWGVKGELGIVDYHGNGIGTNMFRMNAQAYYNLGRLTGLLSSTNEKVGLLAHSGFGVTWSKSLYNNEREHMGNYIIGLSPIFKLNKQFTLSSDFSYAANFKQHFHFDGVPFNPAGVEYKTGNQFAITVGLIYHLGNKDLNADWK